MQSEIKSGHGTRKQLPDEKASSKKVSKNKKAGKDKGSVKRLRGSKPIRREYSPLTSCIEMASIMLSRFTSTINPLNKKEQSPAPL